MPQNHIHVTAQFSGFYTCHIIREVRVCMQCWCYLIVFLSQEAKLNFTNDFKCKFGCIMVSKFNPFKRIGMLRSNLKEKPYQHSVVQWWTRSLKMWELGPHQSVTDAGEITVNFQLQISISILKFFHLAFSVLHCSKLNLIPSTNLEHL